MSSVYVSVEHRHVSDIETRLIYKRLCFIDHYYPIIWINKLQPDTQGREMLHN
jgi:hypothetical protein